MFSCFETGRSLNQSFYHIITLHQSLDHIKNNKIMDNSTALFYDIFYLIAIYICCAMCKGSSTNSFLKNYWVMFHDNSNFPSQKKICFTLALTRYRFISYEFFKTAFNSMGAAAVRALRSRTQPHPNLYD